MNTIRTLALAAVATLSLGSVAIMAQTVPPSPLMAGDGSGGGASDVIKTSPVQAPLMGGDGSGGK